jgi:hypothetical protein
MDKFPIPIGVNLAGLMAAVTIGTITTIASGTPSIAQFAGTQFGAPDHSRVEKVGYVARRGVVVGRAYRGAYVGRGGYGYRRGYGYSVGAGVAGAAAGAIIGGALAAPYYQQPSGYYQQPYGYDQQPYGYYQQPYDYDQEPYGYYQQPYDYYGY